MKKMLYFLLLALLPSSLILADHGFRNLDGNWFARDANHELRIMSKSNGIKVRGLNGQRNWRKLNHSRSARNVFIDRDGNYIEVLGRNHIVHVSKRRWSHRRPFRVTHYVRGRQGRNITCYDDVYYIDRRRNYIDNYQSYNYSQRDYRGNDYQNRNDRYDGPRSDRRYSLEDMIGKWNTQGMERAVYIKREGDGIKARFGGSSKWTFYYRDSRDSQVFVDRKGNRYQLLNQNLLEWISFDGREIKLKRE